MIHPDEEARMEAEVADEIAAAVAFAEAGAWEPVEELTRFMYAERADPVEKRNAATPSHIRSDRDHVSGGRARGDPRRVAPR